MTEQSETLTPERPATDDPAILQMRRLEAIVKDVHSVRATMDTILRDVLLLEELIDAGSSKALQQYYVTMMTFKSLEVSLVAGRSLTR